LASAEEFKPGWWDEYMDPQLDPHGLVEAMVASKKPPAVGQPVGRMREMARFLMSDRLRKVRESGVAAESPDNPRYLSSGKFEDILVEVLLDAARRCDRKDHRCREALAFEDDYRASPERGEGTTIDPGAPETMYGPASSLLRGMRRPPRSDVRLMAAALFIRLLVAAAAGAILGWVVSGPLNVGADWGQGNFLLWWAIGTVGSYIAIGRFAPSRWS
jgi:hypothetical protein